VEHRGGDDRDSLYRKAREAFATGRLRQAHRLCQRILEMDQRHAGAWFICGQIALGNGLLDKAAAIFENVLKLDPQHPAACAGLARALLHQGEMVSATDAARRGLRLLPSAPSTLDTLGALFSQLGDHTAAGECFERALGQLETAGRDNPVFTPEQRAVIYHNAALNRYFRGDAAGAEAACEKAITMWPAFCKAHASLARMRRQTQDRNHLKRLEALRGGVRSPLDRLHLGHALAKEQEDLGEYRAALESLHWGKQQRVQELQYDFEADRCLFEAAQQQFTPEMVGESARGCDDGAPVFIVGLPRSGTTLLERILGAHSEVTAGGELTVFPRSVKRLTATCGERTLDAQTLKAAPRISPAPPGAAGPRRSQERRGRRECRSSWTPHHNIFYTGVIARALPRARVLYLRRHPMDTCLGNYRTLFASGFRYYDYALDLLDCGRYYIAWDHLMQHWRALLPGHVMEVCYEDLVAAPERVVREILAFCGLSWQARCLAFHRLETPVATPSAGQVREPAHGAYVGHWRRYGDALKPLQTLLREAGYEL